MTLQFHSVITSEMNYIYNLNYVIMDFKKQPSSRTSGQKSNESKSSITIIVNGGRNQFLPNATHATQVFYGDKHVADRFTDDNGSSDDAEWDDPDDVSVADASPLSPYCYDEETQDRYLQRIDACHTAQQLASVLVSMLDHPSVNISREVIVKRSFLELVLPLAPRVTTGVDNLRHAVNELMCKKKRRRQL